MRFGEYGEKLAGKYLKAKGYIIVEKNYRKRFGEIDIIALDGKTVVFVEVKARRNLEYGLPREAITKNKIKSIVKVASSFIAKGKFRGYDFRIDLVEILMVDGKPYVCHTENITI